MKQGQTLLEFLILLKGFFLIGMLCFYFCYTAGIRSYLNQLLYESLLCRAKGYSEKKCKDQFTQKADEALVWGKVESIKFQGGEGQWLGSLRWKILKNPLWESKLWEFSLKRILRVPEDLSS